MMAISIRGQQKLISDEREIVNSLLRCYTNRKIPDYEREYIKILEEKIEERKKWIEQQLERIKE